MKAPISVLTFGFSLSLALSTQGAIVYDSLSNQGSTYNLGTWNTTAASSFIVPQDSNYSLTSIALRFSYVTADDAVAVTLRSQAGSGSSMPYSSQALQTFTLEGAFSNGTNTFTTTPFELTAGETYWIVVRRTAGAFGWLTESHSTGTAQPTVGENASSGYVEYSRIPSGPSNPVPVPVWTWVETSSTPALRISASPIPEPSCFTLCLVGLLGAICHRERREHVLSWILEGEC